MIRQMILCFMDVPNKINVDSVIKGNSACGQRKLSLCRTLVGTEAGLLAFKGNGGGTTELPASATDWGGQ